MPQKGNKRTELPAGGGKPPLHMLELGPEFTQVKHKEPDILT